jgi:hypothetical protein
MNFLKAAPSFFASNSTQTSEMIRFIDECRNRFSVEFICKTLKKTALVGSITAWYRPVKGPWGKVLAAFVMLCAG